MILGDPGYLGTGGLGDSPGFLGAAPLGGGFEPSIGLTPAPGTPVPIARDRWGLVSVPAVSPVTPEAEGDPAIWVYLTFLQAFLQTDAGATAAWTTSGVAPGRPAVKRIFPHQPGDDNAAPRGLGFSTNDLPALFMWRANEDGSTAEYWAEDWLVDKTMLKALWVFPTSTQHQQRHRQTFSNQLAKCLVNAIERGRTPSFVVPGDPDPMAPHFGSFVHSFTGVVSLCPLRWGPKRVRITFADGSESEEYRAIEITFEMVEKQDKSPDIWSAPAAVALSLSLGTPMLPGWAPAGIYALNDQIIVHVRRLDDSDGATSQAYVFQATTVTGSGLSGDQTPAWPTTTGATVVDAASGSSITWTCRGPAPTQTPYLTANA